MGSDTRWLVAQWPKIRPYLPPAPAKVVEIGCGSLGGFVPVLTDCGYQAVGIDPQAPEGTIYLQLEFERAELPSEVDAVVACTSLHHVADPAEVLDKVARILIPGGVVVVVEWDWESFDEPTAQWCFERLGGSEGWLHHRRKEWSASAQPWQRYFQTWANNHGLHGARSLIGELDRHLCRDVCSRGAYFFPDLEEVTEADELDAIKSGEISATRIDYVGRRPKLSEQSGRLSGSSTVDRSMSSRSRESGTAGKAVRVLEVDPDLGTGIDESQWQLAERMSIAPAFEFERGPWRFTPPPDPGSLGALVVDGMMVIRIDAGTRAHIELVGQGDVVSPWVGLGPDLALPTEVTASVVARTQIALLDRGFALRTARWPEIHAGLIQRGLARSRRLSLQSAINALSRIDERLDVTLWGLASRFGRVTPDGIVLDLPITHSQLAEVVAAQRPSVSTAVARLQASGRVVHGSRHRWLLRGEPPSALSVLARQTGLQA